ncbi:uncharacterized protein LOC135843862 [Planococcus citri]|uniref:uncharacterized protein LOC135843862 n=1 Tax=Planococcus citri TaxID=170843 RepID=UPI0031F84549
MVTQNFHGVRVLLVAGVLLINKLNVVDGEPPPFSSLCVEPYAPFDETGPSIEPGNQPTKPSPPPTPPQFIGVTEPWNQPTKPTPPPTPPQFVGGVIEPWNQPIPPTPPPSCKKDNAINVKYDTKSPGGELAIKFSYDENIDQGKMNVMISYETETEPAAKFFKEQFTDELVQGFSKCGVIKWDTVPCSISKMKDGQLFCPQGAKQCEFDQIHACAENIYKEDPQKMALFVICFFTQNNNAQECATKNGMVYDEIWKCVSVHGTDLCDLCHRHSSDKGLVKTPNEPPNPVVDPGYGIQPVTDDDVYYPDKNSGSLQGTPHPDTVATPGVLNPVPHDDPPSPGGNPNLDGIADFKGALCAKLDEGKLKKCEFCFC